MDICEEIGGKPWALQSTVIATANPKPYAAGTFHSTTAKSIDELRALRNEEAGQADRAATESAGSNEDSGPGTASPAAGGSSRRSSVECEGRGREGLGVRFRGDT